MNALTYWNSTQFTYSILISRSLIIFILFIARARLMHHLSVSVLSLYQSIDEQALKSN